MAGLKPIFTVQGLGIAEHDWINLNHLRDIQKCQCVYSCTKHTLFHTLPSKYVHINFFFKAKNCYENDKS